MPMPDTVLPVTESVSVWLLFGLAVYLSAVAVSSSVMSLK